MFKIGSKVCIIYDGAGELCYKPAKIVDIVGKFYRLDIDDENEWKAKHLELLPNKKLVVGDYVKLNGKITQITNIGYNKKGKPLFSLEYDQGEEEYTLDDIEPYDGVWPETWIENEDGQRLVLDTHDWDANEGLFIRIDEGDKDDPPTFFVSKNDKEKFIQTLKNMIAEVEAL